MIAANVVALCGMGLTNESIGEDETLMFSDFIDLDMTEGELIVDAESGTIEALKDGIYQISYGGTASLT